MAEQTEKIDFSAARHVPANFCHLRHTNEEFLIDFGMTGADKDSPSAIIDTSLVISPYTAKRLLHSLATIVRNYEQHFGEIQTNFEDRLVAQQPVPVQPQAPPPQTPPQTPPQAPPIPQVPRAPMHVPVPPGAVQQLNRVPTEAKPPRGFWPKHAAMGALPADIIIDAPQDQEPTPPLPQEEKPPGNSPCNPGEEP